MPRDRFARLRYICRFRSRLARNLLCECFGTGFLLFTGFNINAQTILSRSQMNASLGMIIGWGLCLTFAVQMSYSISGSHYNPAVSLFVWSFGQIPFLHFIWYSIAQTIGAFCAAALTYVYYFEKINEFDGGVRTVFGPNATAGIFATYPGDHLSIYGAIFDQIIATMALCIIIRIINDPHNHIPRWVQPPMFGAMLTAISLGFNLNTGNAMNPARDIGPRFFTYLIGYGSAVFSFHNYTWFLVPIICPLLGGLMGAWLYQVIIGVQYDDDVDVKVPNELISTSTDTDLLKETKHTSLVLIKW